MSRMRFAFAFRSEKSTKSPPANPQVSPQLSYILVLIESEQRRLTRLQFSFTAGEPRTPGYCGVRYLQSR